MVGQIPGLDLMLHASIFFLHVPDLGFEGGVLFFGLIDDALEVVVFVPDDVLGGHVAVEIDVRVENVVVGVYFFLEVLFGTHSLVEATLAGLKRFVVAAQNKERCVIYRFHYGKCIIRPEG